MLNVSVPSDPDDILIWCDGTWCFREDLSDFGHMSDDFEVITAFSEDYFPFLRAADAMEPEEFREFLKVAP